MRDLFRRLVSPGSACIFLAAILIAPQARALGFSASDLTFGPPSFSTHVVLDASGSPHVLFYNSNLGQLVYGERQGLGWSFENVAFGATQIGLVSGLALDSQGGPRVVYFKSGTNEVFFASRVGERWVVDKPGVSRSTNPIVAIATGPGDASYVAFVTSTNGVTLAIHSVSGWSIHALSGVVVGKAFAMSVDATGLVHVVYSKTVGGTTFVNYGVFDSIGNQKFGTTTQTVTSGSNANLGIAVGITLDNSSRVQIAYGTGDDLAFTEKTTDTFVTPITVDAGTDIVSTQLSLGRDGSGEPVVAYYDSTHKDLKVASRNQGTWSTQTVAATGDVGYDCSLATDLQGNAFVTYRDATRNTLVLLESDLLVTAPGPGDRWASGHRETVRWTGVGPVDVSLSLDGGFSYSTVASNVQGNELAVTVPTAQTASAIVQVTRAEPVSSSGSGLFSIGPELGRTFWAVMPDTLKYGTSIALALDANGVPRIAFWDVSTLRVTYFERVGGNWNVSAHNPPVGTIGANVNLGIVGPTGNPIIAYYDNATTHRDLRFAWRVNMAWSDTLLDGAGNVGLFASMKVDASGNAHIAYYDATSLKPKYALVTPVGPLWAWSTEFIGTDTNAGTYTNLAVSRDGRVHVTYRDASTNRIKYAVRAVGGGWSVSVVDTLLQVPGAMAMCLDRTERPIVAWSDPNEGLIRVSKNLGAGIWKTEVINRASPVYSDGEGLVLASSDDGHTRLASTSPLVLWTENAAGWSGEQLDDGTQSGLFVDSFLGFAVDAQGSPRFAYSVMDVRGREHLNYGSTAVELLDPIEGASWPVGATREIHWDGPGIADVSLSVDGGLTFRPLAAGVRGQSYRLIVPDSPSNSCKLKVERGFPRSVALSDSFFAITGGASLVAFRGTLNSSGAGTLLTWDSSPGLDDLAGYRLERRDGSVWKLLQPQLRATQYSDPEGRLGSRYRLAAVNGLGEDLLLGEMTVVPPQVLSASPSPYREGSLNIGFVVETDADPVEIGLYDILGRRVAVLAKGRYARGPNAVAWDGRDRSGHRANAGVYFVSMTNGGHTHTLKVPIVE